MRIKDEDYRGVLTCVVCGRQAVYTSTEHYTRTIAVRWVRPEDLHAYDTSIECKAAPCICPNCDPAELARVREAGRQLYVELQHCADQQEARDDGSVRLAIETWAALKERKQADGPAYNPDNQSAHIDPDRYSSSGPEVVTVTCGRCGVERTERAAHSMTNLQLAQQCFKGWVMLGVRGAKRTRCPGCAKKRG